MGRVRPPRGRHWPTSGPRRSALAHDICKAACLSSHSRAHSLPLHSSLSLPPRRAECRRATEQLCHRLVLAPPRHYRLQLANSCIAFPSTSSTWLLRQTRYGEGEITVPVLTGELSFHGCLYDELAATWLACIVLLIPCIRAWSGCRLASGMTSL